MSIAASPTPEDLSLNVYHLSQSQPTMIPTARPSEYWLALHSPKPRLGNGISGNERSGIEPSDDEQFEREQALAGTGLAEKQLPQNNLSKSYGEKFTLLPLLPVEIQIKIWKHYTYFTPRALGIRSVRPDCGPDDPNIVPPIFHISSSIKALAFSSLNYYFLELPKRVSQSNGEPKANTHTKILYNPFIDILVFPLPEFFTLDGDIPGLGRTNGLRDRARCIAVKYSAVQEGIRWFGFYDSDPNVVMAQTGEDSDGERPRTNFEAFVEDLELQKWKRLECVFIIVGTRYVGSFGGRRVGFEVGGKDGRGEDVNIDSETDWETNVETWENAWGVEVVLVRERF